MLNKKNFSAVKLVIFDFDGVFTDNTVYVTQDGIESVRCWRSDGLGIERLKLAGIKTCILSTEKNPVVQARADKLGIRFIQGSEDKAVGVLKICNELMIELSETMFVGNDINDIPALKIVGFPCAVADAYPAINDYVLYKSVRPGGMGAVREICESILDALHNKCTDQI